MPRAALTSLAVLALLLASFTPPASAKTHRNIKYATVDDIPLYLDLYLSDKSDTPPRLVVWIHGGGWQKGSKDRCPITWLTGHGYAVASVQYRLTDKGSFPDQIHDCKGAVRWLRANADKYGYNAQRIGVAGISAGGHLVALLGTSGDVKELEGDVGGNLDQSSRVQAVLDMCGPSDFLLRAKKNPAAVNKPGSAVYKLLGGSVPEKKDLAEQASPVSHVTKDDAPLLIFHGTKDPLVHPQQSEHLRELYEEAGLEVTLEMIEGGGHVPKQFWDQTRRDMALEHFNKHLAAPK